MIQLLYWLDLAGVAVFAISGALEAARKQLDPVGFLFVAAVTGIGGGTLRDVLLDRPLVWLHEPIYLWTTSAMALITFFIAPHLQRRAVVLLWADALGMALFCALDARPVAAAELAAYSEAIYAARRETRERNETEATNRALSIARGGCDDAVLTRARAEGAMLRDADVAAIAFGTGHV